MTTYALVGTSEFSSEQFSARNGAGAFDAVIAVDGGFASLAAVGCACGKTGDGSLESCRRDGENQGKDGKNQLVNAQPFCTNCSGKEYFIVETDESADDSRGGQEQSA